MELKHALEDLRGKIGSFRPYIAVTLGSGLGGFADTLDRIEHVVDYRELRDFPVSTTSLHRGRFVFGYSGGVPVAVMQGRIHFYEGYSVEQTVMPLRLLRLLGTEMILLTNASGGIHPDFQAGDFMLIEDQISFLMPSPLRGTNDDDLGPRFPDMTEIYDAALRRKILAAAEAEGIPLRRGVLIQTRGPNFESPAEIRFCRLAGADAVCMSTATEAIAARHCGMKVGGISVIANLAAGISPNPLSLEEVEAASCAAAPRFEALLHRLITSLHEV